MNGEERPYFLLAPYETGSFFCREKNDKKSGAKWGDVVTLY